MVDQNVLAALFGFAIFYGFLIFRKAGGTRKSCLPEETAATTVIDGGECRSKDGGGEYFDVIIVGAGVAGAALAHTLGKVYNFLFMVKINGSSIYNIFLGNIYKSMYDVWAGVCMYHETGF